MPYYIDGQGSLQAMPGGYDGEAGAVSLATRHFSTFAVGYHHPPRFADVAEDAWYDEAVAYVAAREIVTGEGNGYFNPSGDITRGQAVVMLMRAFGIAPDELPSDNFADAGETYYTGYLAAAKRLGLAEGVGGNRFTPDASISRQDLAVLIRRVLNGSGYESLLAGRKNTGDWDGFGDREQIADYAVEAMKTLVQHGVMEGNEGLLAPRGTGSRAQMAQLLFRIMKVNKG